jgi:hypothetical protein
MYLLFHGFGIFHDLGHRLALLLWYPSQGGSHVDWDGGMLVVEHSHNSLVDCSLYKLRVNFKERDGAKLELLTWGAQ